MVVCAGELRTLEVRAKFTVKMCEHESLADGLTAGVTYLESLMKLV